jgi:cold-inducible RNA-binding protein
MNLFVARLSSSITDDDLNQIFSPYGEIKSAKVIFDRETGNSKGYGFVEMPDDEEAKAAIEALNESEVDGKQIVVKESAPAAEKPRRDFKRGGSGSFNRGGGGYNRSGGSYNRGGDQRQGGERRRRTSDRDRRNGGGYNRSSDWE